MRSAALLVTFFTIRKILTVFAILAVEIVTYGQGTINFDNLGVSAPIAFPDGSSGPGIFPDARAALYIDSAGSLTLVPGSVTTFFANSGEGSKYLSALTVVVPSVAPGAPGTFQVAVWWQGTSFETAAFRGLSNPFTVVTGGAGSPPSLPGDLTGLQPMVVPEPGMLALAAIGALALFCRKKLKR
jgi:hypothetical protein